MKTWLRVVIGAALLVGVALAVWLWRRPNVHPTLPPALVTLAAGEHSIVLAGDTMTWDRTQPLLEAHGANYPFEATAPIFQHADLAVLNLEGPVASEAQLVAGKWHYRVPPWTLDGLRWAGIDQVSLANNHLYDCGAAGVMETLRRLGDRRIGAFGLEGVEGRGANPQLVTVAGVRIALLGFVAAETLYPEAEDVPASGSDPARERELREQLGANPTRPGAAIATAGSVRTAVQDVARKADLAVVFIHFGVRYHRPPTTFQQQVARAAIDAGAALVVGHHAHFWQPVGVHRGRAIVYGTGNFAFGSANRRANEALVVRAVLAGRAVTRLELLPLAISNRNGLVRYQPKVLRSSSAREMLERVSAASREYAANVEIEQVASGALRGVVRLSK